MNYRRTVPRLVLHAWIARGAGAGPGTTREIDARLKPHKEALLDAWLGPPPGWDDEELGRRWRAWLAIHREQYVVAWTSQDEDEQAA